MFGDFRRSVLSASAVSCFWSLSERPCSLLLFVLLGLPPIQLREFQIIIQSVLIFCFRIILQHNINSSSMFDIDAP